MAFDDDFDQSLEGMRYALANSRDATAAAQAGNVRQSRQILNHAIAEITDPHDQRALRRQRDKLR
jgi:hypothetical protein